jgi:hypothetical protein
VAHLLADDNGVMTDLLRALDDLLASLLELLLGLLQDRGQVTTSFFVEW